MGKEYQVYAKGVNLWIYSIYDGELVKHENVLVEERHELYYPKDTAMVCLGNTRRICHLKELEPYWYRTRQEMTVWAKPGVSEQQITDIIVEAITSYHMNRLKKNLAETRTSIMVINNTIDVLGGEPQTNPYQKVKQDFLNYILKELGVIKEEGLRDVSEAVD